MRMQIGDIEFYARNNFGGEVGGPNVDGTDSWEVVDVGENTAVKNYIIANLYNTVDLIIHEIFFV